MRILGDVVRIVVMKIVIPLVTVIRIKTAPMVEVDVWIAAMLICAITAAAILIVAMQIEIDKDEKERKKRMKIIVNGEEVLKEVISINEKRMTGYGGEDYGISINADAAQNKVDLADLEEIFAKVESLIAVKESGEEMDYSQYSKLFRVEKRVSDETSSLNVIMGIK